MLDIVDKKYEKTLFEDITHDENGDYLTIVSHNIIIYCSKYKLFYFI